MRWRLPLPRGRAVAGDVPQATRWCDEAAALIDGLPDRVLAAGLMGVTMLAAAQLFLHWRRATSRAP